MQADATSAHSPQQVALGTLILWLGWILFNGGSSAGITGDNGVNAQIAIVNTILAPSAAGVFTFLIKGYVAGEKGLPKSNPDDVEDEIRMDF